MKRMQVLACMIVGMALLAPGARGNIYLDEDFEGPEAFVDRNWPVQGDNRIPPTPATVAVKGANLRAYNVGNFDYRSPKPVYHNTGTLTQSRRFLGAQGLQLASGQSVGVSPMVFAGNEIGEYRVFQFAVATDSATASLPTGTRIGFFRSDWSTTTEDIVQASFSLDFVVNGLGTVDVISSNTATRVTTLAPGRGNWALISIITQIRPDDMGYFEWNAHDPLTNTDKGTTQGLVLPGGMHIYVDGKSEALHVFEDQIGTGWGSDDSSNSVWNSRELGWEIAAVNGGTLFVDELYWDGGYHSLLSQAPEEEGFAREEAARMNDFEQSTIEWSGKGRSFFPR